MTTWLDYFETNDYKRALPDAHWHFYIDGVFELFLESFLNSCVIPYSELYGHLNAEKQIYFFNREWLDLKLRWLQSHTKILAWVHPLPHPSLPNVCAPLKFPDCVVKVAFPACRHFGYSTLHINIAHFFSCLSLNNTRRNNLFWRLFYVCTWVGSLVCDCIIASYFELRDFLPQYILFWECLSLKIIYLSWFLEEKYYFECLFANNCAMHKEKDSYFSICPFWSSCDNLAAVLLEM